MTTRFGREQALARGLAVQHGGKVVVVGEAGARFALAVYTRNGRLDRSFGGDGRVRTKFHGGHAIASAVAVQGSDKIVAAGGASGKFALARYHGG